MKHTMFAEPKNKILSPKFIRERFESNSFPDENGLEDSLSYPIQKKREEIFNPELQSLVERVKSPRNATVLPLSGSTFFKQYKNLIPPEKKQEQELLESIYMPNDAIQDTNIMSYTSYILERVGIHTFSWHFLAYDSNAYFSEMSQGVDIVTRKNFLFLKSDPYIKRLDDNFFELTITHDLKKDPFFSKKFSTESLSLYSKIYFFFLDEPYVDACLVAFLEKSQSESQESDSESVIRDKWLRRISDKIFSLVPAIKRYRNEKLQPRFSKDDMLTALIYHFKTFIGHGLSEFYVHKVQFQNLTSNKDHYYLEKQFISQVLHFLGKREKVIYIGIHTYLVFSTQSLESKIAEIASKDDIDILIKVRNYPLDGENILAYL